MADWASPDPASVPYIHATAPDTIGAYLKDLQPEKKALAKLNALRVMAGNPEI